MLHWRGQEYAVRSSREKNLVPNDSVLHHSIPAGIFHRLQSLRKDLFLILLLGLLAGLGSFYGSRLIDEVVFEEDSSSSYFEADVPRVYANMSDRGSNHYRTRVHPLFSLIAGAPVLALKKTLGIPPALSIRLYVALVALLWTATLLGTFRLLGCRRAESTVFTLLALTSSAAMFWFIVPETYSFGSLSILWAVLLVVMAQRKRTSERLIIATSALTLSFTVTNWMAGILASAFAGSRKRTLHLSYHALVLVILLWGIQKAIYPSANFISSSEESRYILQEESGGPARVLASFFYHSVVMPRIGVVDRYHREEWPIMITQMSAPGSGSIAGLAAVITWSMLLILGIWASTRAAVPSRIRVLIWLILCGQLVLHLLYGEETFLYALHFAPVLILLASLAALTRFRRAAVLLAGVTAVLALVNNVGRLEEVMAFYRVHGSERHIVKAQMTARPNDPWPRGAGHVILAMPGSRGEEKGYLEPGGSFSPSPGSFGISIWGKSDRGDLITSDSIPLERIDQRFSSGAESAVPAIETRTDYYRSNCTLLGPGRSRLMITPGESGSKLMAVIRSVGPAGGPIHSISWDGERLLIEHRWEVRFSPRPDAIHLGREGSLVWTRENGSSKEVTDPDGWCYARCEMASRKPSSIWIADRSLQDAKTADRPVIRSPLKVVVPDPGFVSCLEAQLFHLQMGRVEGESRPGDPMNYATSWLRDESYIITALAASGMTEEAKELCLSVAYNDFFGGFGSEADAPGLAIWALEEIAARTADPDFDRFLWPHIRRKARLIEAMLSNDKPLFMPYKGVLTPELVDKLRSNGSISKGYGAMWPMLTAEPAKDGLMMGKMDNHFPVLFVTAVNYRGLLSAADLAARLGKSAEAAAWRSKAENVRRAWLAAMDLDTFRDDRTYACGLWPSGIASPEKGKYERALDDRWRHGRKPDGSYIRNPLYTYFDLAEAHQWLYLDRPDRVWKSLEWFWTHQSSPGLFTWWEGAEETNTAHLWEKVRGWVDPKTVTPHYWSAAEMVMLQLDMLAYLEGGGDELVVGEGVPRKWIESPMSVEGMTLPGLRLSWFWDGKIMRVETRGKKVNVRLGPSFPPETQIRIYSMDSEKGE